MVIILIQTKVSHTKPHLDLQYHHQELQYSESPGSWSQSLLHTWNVTDCYDHQKHGCIKNWGWNSHCTWKSPTIYGYNSSSIYTCAPEHQSQQACILSIVGFFQKPNIEKRWQCSCNLAMVKRWYQWNNKKRNTCVDWKIWVAMLWHEWMLYMEIFFPCVM